MFAKTKTKSPQLLHIFSNMFFLYVFKNILFICLCTSLGCLCSFCVILSLPFLFICLFFLLTCFHHFKNVLCVSHVPPASPRPILLLHFPFNQLCACSSCDFVIWLLHGADDVVFAGQQKVIFFVLFCLV